MPPPPPLVRFIRYESAKGARRAEITHQPAVNVHHWHVVRYAKTIAIDDPTPTYRRDSTRVCDTLGEAQQVARHWCR